MCAACRQEYESPQNRRFHAQPNACADCGPQLYFHSGSDLSHGDAALSHAVSLLQQGGLLALKGLGGYQILGDARSETVVERLRQRKKRPSKPFAIMIPDEGPYLEAFHLRPGEQALLESVQSPIVLLNWQHAPPSWLAPSVFGPSPAIGVMKPYTPLHVLLLNDLGFPVIATSGNLADEPICIDPDQATAKLAPLVDGFLHHTRPILRPVDDSVAQVIRGKAQVLRRARGYAPFPLANLQAQGKDLALGGHLKATFCFSHRQQVFFSQHIGDLESPQSRESYLETLKDLPRMYDQSPEDFSTVACDSHPDYYSSRVLPEREKLPVQHHRAHLYSVMAEHGLKGPILGFAWDGTGWGDDGTIWGGEVFSGDHRQLTRVGSLHPFPLLGGDHSAKEPWRTALSLMVTVFPHQDPRELLNLLEHVPLGHQLSEAQTLPTLGALNRGIRCITTTSMGRLLDGISALLGLATHNTHEGFAPVALQRAAQLYCAETPVSGISFPWLPRPASFSENAPEWVLDWRPALKQLFKEFREGAQAAWALRCHVGLAMAIRDLSLRFPGIPILLSGGVFQNQRLMEMVLDLMQPHQREVYFNEQVPPNDGGLALGQWFAAEQGNFP
jgi:hydrogenase maturation protein HypF